MTKSKYIVVRDSRDKMGKGWYFEENSQCGGTIIQGLPTGDYSLVGLEDKFVIERKASLAEFSANLVQKRFDNELGRLEKYEHPFIILEFPLEHFFTFPRDSGIPPNKWRGLRLTSQFLLKRLAEIQLKYKTKIIFADDRGEEIARVLFKNVWEQYNGCKEKD